MRSWVMQLKIDGVWKSVRGVGGESYRFRYRNDAASRLNALYPDQCRIERLNGHHEPYLDGENVRIAEIDEPPNTE